MATGCHDVLSLLSTYVSTTRVYTHACGPTCDMGHPERRERERKATTRDILGWYTVNCLIGHSAWPVRSSAKKTIEIRVSL